MKLGIEMLIVEITRGYGEDTEEDTYTSRCAQSLC